MAETTLTHPDSKQILKVAPEHADVYLSQGWVEKKAKALAPKPDPKAAE